MSSPIPVVPEDRPLELQAVDEVISCPECGEMATVETAQRRSEDFCRTCDYPLFWAKSSMVAPSWEQTGASLRRLPGTVGRAATAALDCPQCGEPNAPTAMVCIRCGGDMHPAAPEPAAEPAAVYVPLPEAEPEPEPEVRDHFWWLLGAALVLLLLIAGVVWLVQR